MLALVASQCADLDGTLQTAAANGGIGCEVDISSADILVAPVPRRRSPARSCSQRAASTLWARRRCCWAACAPARRSTRRRRTSKLPTARRCRRRGAARADRPDSPSIAAQPITAAGTAPVRYIHCADGRRRVPAVGSAGPQITVTRSNTPGSSGVLSLQTGSRCSAPGGSVYLEASSNVLSNGSLSLTGAIWRSSLRASCWAQSRRAVPGTVLGASVLGAQGLRNLLLQSGV